jgi:hypothetical protein
MINVYKSYAQRWRRAVRMFTLDVWKNRDDEKSRNRYEDQAELFAKEFRSSLEKHYKSKGIQVYRGTIDGKVADWLERQYAMEDTLADLAKKRKDDLVADEIKKLKEDEERDVQESLDRIYALKDDEKVYKVFSFAQNFEGTADRHGDDEAYGLGREINESVLKDNSDRYFWRKQRDARVRKTHEMLADFCFLFDDPPTTIDKYGNTHTGNAGTDWGCRCWGDLAPPREKAKRNFIVREK